MKHCFLNKQGHRSLVLFFAGWGMDEHPFKDICPEKEDVLMCYDYRDTDFDSSLLKDYDVVRLVAWSLGVWAAAEWQSAHLGLSLTSMTAINGTLYPIDDQRGIPPIIYNGTVDGLNEKNRQRFMRRMCGGAEAYRLFQSRQPQRPVGELSEELVAIRERYLSEQNGCDACSKWSRTFISSNDLIFPPSNQKKGWEGHCNQVITADTPHYDERLLASVLNGHE